MSVHNYCPISRMLQLDSNCVQIVAPSGIVLDEGNSFGPSERLGNVSREVAKVIADFMDNDNIVLDE